MKFYGLILLFFSLTFYAQTSEIDSLKLLINKSKKERTFERINQLADLYSDSDLKTAQIFAKEAISIAKKEKNNEFLALAYNSLGNILQYKSELDSSLVYTQKSLELRIQNKDSLGIADSYNNLGIIYDQKADYPEALKNYFNALNIYEKKKDDKKQAMVASNIGVVYKAQKDYKKSLKYYFIAYEIYKKQKNDFGLAVTTGNIGSTLIPFKKYKEALEYSKMSEDGYKKLGYDRFRGYPVSNMAAVYDSLRDYRLANEHYLRAIELHEKYENGVEVADNSKNFAEFLLRQKNYIESEKYALKALQFAEKSDAKLIVNETQLILAKAYSAQGKYDLAYQYQQKYLKGREEIFETEKTKSVIELEKKYQTEKKDKEILENKNKIFKRNIYIFSLLGLLLLGAGIAFSIFRHRRKNEKIKLQREILNQQELAAKAVMNAEDNERRRMATGLHDGVAQLLGAANMNVSALEDFKDDEENFSKILEKTQNILGDAIKDVRLLSHQIMPSMLMNHSLKEALTLLVEKSVSPKLKINFAHQGIENKIDEHIEVVIFRTVQEAINNAVKHGNATEITIFSEQSENKISVSISDNGKGFEVDSKNADFSGLGLQNIKSRINLLKGEMNITSNDKGTKLYIKIPLKN